MSLFKLFEKSHYNDIYGITYTSSEPVRMKDINNLNKECEKSDE